MRENDERIREAMIAEIVAVGWDEVALTGIAKRAGLSVGALYARAETKSELGNWLWSAVVRDWLADALAALLAAARTGRGELLGQAYAALESRTELAHVATELMVASHFDDELAEVVGADTRRFMRDLRLGTQPGAGDPVPPAVQAAHALVLSFALGRLMARRSVPDLPPMADWQLRTQAGMTSAADAPPPAMAPQPILFLRQSAELAPELRALSESVLSVVGRVGFRRATIARMSRAAGMSGGSLLTRFQDKAHVVSYCAVTQLLTPLELWHEYDVVVEQAGPLPARAMWVSQALRPENAPYWRLHLELARAAVAIPELAAFGLTDEPHLYANLGVMFVGSFSDDLHDLPFHVPFGAGSAT